MTSTPADTAAPAPDPSTIPYATLDDLFRPRLEEIDEVVEGVGKVRIRALSRLEVLELRGKSLPIDEMERRMLALALVQPRVTVLDLQRWQEHSAAGEIEKLSRKAARLSKLTEGADKATVAEFRG